MPLPVALAGAGAFLARWGPTALSMMGNANTTSRNLLPTLSESMDVIVYGNPQSKRQDLWRLAMGLLWSKIQRRDTIRLLPPPGTLLMEYSLEGNWVRVYMEQVTPYTSGLFGAFRKRRDIELFTGPQKDSYVGGYWAYTSALPGSPGGGISSLLSSIGGQNSNIDGVGPKNGFEDRVIMTSAHVYQDKSGKTLPSRSPAPPGDGISRGVNPVASDLSVVSLTNDNISKLAHYLLWSPLSEPCSTTGMVRDVKVEYNTIPPIRTATSTADLVTEYPQKPQEVRLATPPANLEAPQGTPLVEPNIYTGIAQDIALSTIIGTLGVTGNG